MPSPAITAILFFPVLLFMGSNSFVSVFKKIRCNAALSSEADFVAAAAFFQATIRQLILAIKE
jgi:hypothetical protein